MEKMKIIKNLSKWQTWIFVILPWLMLFSCLAIAIYGAAVKSLDVSLVILSEILFMIAVILFSCYPVFKLIRRKAVWRVVAIILFMVCFLGLRVSYTVKLPTYFDVSKEYETQYKELKDIPNENNDEYWKKRDDLHQVGDLRNELKLTLDILHWGSLCAFFAARCCEGNIKKEEEQEKELELKG